MNNDLHAWIEMFFRRRRAFAYASGWVLVFLVVALMICPPFFTSSAKILIQQDRAQLLVSPDIQGQQNSPHPGLDMPIQEQDLNSEIELLTSSYLIEQTLQGLTPGDTSLAQRLLTLASQIVSFPSTLYGYLHDTQQPTADQVWAAKVASHLTCKVIKRSNIIELTFTSHNAQWSRDFLARLIDQYLILRATISHDPAAQAFFNQQANLLKAKLERSENDLRNLKLQTGITDLAGQESSLINEVGTARAEYSRDQSELAGTIEKIDYLNQQLGSYPQHIDAETKLVQNYALQTLKPQLLELEAERADLLTRYRPDSERIQSIDAKLKTARALLQREDTREVQEVRNSINPTWQTLSTQLAQAKVALATLQASQAERSKELADDTRQMSVLTRTGLDIQRLQQQVDTDKEVYLSYLRKGEEARAAKALNLNKILNVSLATPPSLPLKPVFPKIPTDIYAVVFLACGFGLIFGYWTEARDERIFSPAMITAVSGLPTVALLRSEHE